MANRREAIQKESIQQERIDEANVVETLSAAAEKAAEMIGERAHELERAKEAIRERDERIKELESHDSDVHGVFSDGSSARSARLARMNKAIDALKKAGVVGGVLLIAGLGLAVFYPHLFSGIRPVQVATQEAPPAGFQYSLTRSFGPG
jgi:hypothetical protein